MAIILRKRIREDELFDGYVTVSYSAFNKQTNKYVEIKERTFRRNEFKRIKEVYKTNGYELTMKKIKLLGV